MIEMKVVTSYSGDEGFVRRGDPIRVSPARSRVLQRKGLAVPIGGPGPSEAQAVVPEETKGDEPAKRVPDEGVVSLAWRCGIDGCDREFASKRGLTVHRRSAHPEVKDEPEGLDGEG